MIRVHTSPLFREMMRRYKKVGEEATGHISALAVHCIMTREEYFDHMRDLNEFMEGIEQSGGTAALALDLISKGKANETD